MFHLGLLTRSLKVCRMWKEKNRMSVYVCVCERERERKVKIWDLMENEKLLVAHILIIWHGENVTERTRMGW